jgi:hypothetical protein
LACRSWRFGRSELRVTRDRYAPLEGGDDEERRPRRRPCRALVRRRGGVANSRPCAAALVGAGILSVLIFPLVALSLRRPVP